MATMDDFAQQCDRASRDLRRIPKDVRRDLASSVKERVAVPLAGKVSGAAAGPYRVALSGGVKARAAADPQIVIGGAKKVVSGGASVRQLIYGTEFSGGKRYAIVNRPTRNGRRRKGRVSAKERAAALANGKTIYKRHTTNQFVPGHPFVFSTISKNGDWVLDTFADIVMDTLAQGGF